MSKQTLTAAAAQLINRQAAFAAIETAEAHLALGATSPRHLERMADAILAADGFEVASDAKARIARENAEAREAKRTRCAIDRFAQRSDTAALAADLILAGQDIAALVTEATTTKRRVPTYAERKAATALAHKTRVRTVKTAGRGAAPAKAALKAQQARVAAIAAGLAQVVPTQAFPNLCPPPRAAAARWALCRTWDDPNAALRFHFAR